MEQRSEEWFKARVGVITGSRVGSILGVNPFATREDVMREMVREHLGAEKEFQGNAATNHGERMEPVALAYYEKTQMQTVEQTGLVKHDLYDWLGASPDGLIGLNGGLEIKCPYWAKKPYSVYEKPGYYAQVQHVMEVCDLDWMDFFVYISEDCFTVERVARDIDWFATNLPKLEAFRSEYLEVIGDGERSAKHLGSGVLTLSHPKARRFAELFTLLKAAEIETASTREEFDALKKELGSEFGSFEAAGVKLQRIDKKGSVNSKTLYSDINLDKLLKEAGKTLDDYRNPGVVSFNVSFIGGKE
jgi:putative phage-type endonuclease